MAMTHHNAPNTASSNSRLLVRTDAGNRIGIGHLMRCLTIAQKWKKAGGQVTFLMTPLEDGLKALFNAYNFELRIQEVEPGSVGDARQTAALAEELVANWIIADGYWFGPDFQRIARTGVSRLMLIDALGTPQHNCADLILNANIYAVEDYYRNRESHTRLLLGPDYLPLRTAFTRQQPEPKRPDDQSDCHVLVSLGGGDPENATGRILELLTEFPVTCRCSIVIGPANRNRAQLEKLTQGHEERITLLVSPDNMPELMQQADMAILAGGSTVWEALFIGVPVLLLSYAENQVRVASKLGELGYCLYAGHLQGELPAKFGQDLNALLTDASLRETLSRRGRQLIDGRGVERIVDAMLSHPSKTYGTKN